MQASSDTIAAIATPPGTGGVGVVRISGAAVPELIEPLTGGRLQTRRAHYTAFLDANGTPIDRGVALYFPAPRSFTGEHVLERLEKLPGYLLGDARDHALAQARDLPADLDVGDGASRARAWRVGL